MFNTRSNKLRTCLNNLKQKCQQPAQKLMQALTAVQVSTYHDLTYSGHLKQQRQQKHAEHLRNPKLTAEMNWVLAFHIKNFSEEMLVKKCANSLSKLTREGAYIPESLAAILKPLGIQQMKEIPNLKRLHPSELFDLHTKVSRELYKHEQAEHMTIGQVRKPSG